MGIRPVINAAGAATITGGSLMSPETAEAMVDAARAFVMVEELNARVGEKIAEVTGAEAGVLHRTEQQLVERVFKLSDLGVKALMVPRTDIRFLLIDDPIARVRAVG